jgi:hypothetical protein
MVAEKNVVSNISQSSGTAQPEFPRLTSRGCGGPRISWTVVACALIVLQLGCGGSPQTSSTAVSLVIHSASPIPTVNGSAFTMDVYGSGFVSGVVVLVEGSSLPSPFVPTTFVDSTHLTAAIPANAYTAPTGGFIYVYLANPPNCTNQYCNLGLWSNAFDFQVQPGS